jgi:hypothetical protein
MDPLGFDRFKAVAKDCMAGGVEQRFHRRPLSQKGLAYLVA